jgi:hypothetical protein
MPDGVELGTDDFVEVSKEGVVDREVIQIDL